MPQSTTTVQQTFAAGTLFSQPVTVPGITIGFGVSFLQPGQRTVTMQLLTPFGWADMLSLNTANAVQPYGGVNVFDRRWFVAEFIPLSGSAIYRLRLSASLTAPAEWYYVYA